MLNTSLVQRLDIKPNNERMAMASRVFGGHALGLSNEGWKAIQSVFDINQKFARSPRF